MNVGFEASMVTIAMNVGFKASTVTIAMMVSMVSKVTIAMTNFWLQNKRG